MLVAEAICCTGGVRVSWRVSLLDAGTTLGKAGWASSLWQLARGDASDPDASGRLPSPHNVRLYSNSPISGLLYLRGSIGGTPERPQGDVSLRLYDGALGSTRLASAQASMAVDERQVLTFGLDAAPAESRQAGQVQVSGVVPLAPPQEGAQEGLLDVLVRVKDSGMMLVSALVPDVRWLQGQADVLLHVGGTLQARVGYCATAHADSMSEHVHTGPLGGWQGPCVQGPADLSLAQVPSEQRWGDDLPAGPAAVRRPPGRAGGATWTVQGQGDPAAQGEGQGGCRGPSSRSAGTRVEGPQCLFRCEKGRKKKGQQGLVEKRGLAAICDCIYNVYVTVVQACLTLRCE